MDDDSRLHNNISSVGNVYTYAGNTATVIVSNAVVFSLMMMSFCRTRIIWVMRILTVLCESKLVAKNINK